MFSWMTQIACVSLCLLILSCSVICCVHIMIAQLVCTVVVMQPTTVYHMIFIGGTYVNMSETGFAIAPNVFISSPSSSLMAPFSLGFTNTLGVDYVGELPPSPSGNKWILTAVCPYSNYLHAIHVSDKTATTAANALFHEIFLQLGFPSVLQSDRGGEFLNALLH